MARCHWGPRARASSSSARATSACRSRCAPSRWASTSSASTSTTPRSSGSPSGQSHVEDVPDGRLAAALRHRPLPHRRPTSPTWPGSTSRSSRCRRRCATTQPDLTLHRGRGRGPRPPPARRRHGRPRVDHVPGHDRGAGRADPRGGLGTVGRPRLPPRLQPRAHRSRQHDVDPREHAQGRLRHRRRRRWPRSAWFYDQLVDTHGARPVAEGGRAHQAAGEHLPAREHRAGQRAGHVRPRPGHRRVGRHRRGVDQAVRLHAVHAGSGRRRALPARSTRATCRGRCAARSVGRSGSSSWPTTSTSTCPTTS